MDLQTQFEMTRLLTDGLSGFIEPTPSQEQVNHDKRSHEQEREEAWN